MTLVFANSPRSVRGLRLKGIKYMVYINYSTKTQNTIGALGDGILHLWFQDKADLPNAIAMLDEFRQEYCQIFVTLDCALAHKSKIMQKYLTSVNGDIILHLLPPHCPQHNPIEIQWREIKRAITCRFFEGGFEEMKVHTVAPRLERGGHGKVAQLHARRNRYCCNCIRTAHHSTVCS